MPLPPYPAVPAPGTWAASSPILTSQLRNDAANAITFLANRPGFLGWCTTGPSITAGSITALDLDTEGFDTWSGHSPLGTQPNWYCCQAPGWYLGEAFCAWAYTSSTQLTFQTSVSVGVSGGTAAQNWGEITPSASTRNPAPIAVDLVQLNNTGQPDASPVTGDYITMQVRVSGSNESVASSSGLYPRLAVRWVAATSGTAGLSVPPNPSWPVPPAYVTSSFLNANIRDTIRFLTYPPLFRGYASGSATLGSNAAGAFPAGSVIALANTTVDNYSGWGGSGNYWQAPVAGCYYLYGQVQFSPQGATGAASAGLKVNAGTIIWGRSARSGNASSGVCAAVMKRLRLNAGDDVQLVAQQSFGSTLTIGSDTRLIAVWETA
jgi:hypothetical protein